MARKRAKVVREPRFEADERYRIEQNLLSLVGPQAWSNADVRDLVKNSSQMIWQRDERIRQLEGLIEDLRAEEE